MRGSVAAIHKNGGASADLAGLKPVQECLQSFTRERQWINEQHLELCRIPAPTFLEQKRAAWMAAKLRDTGWDSRIDRAGNVVATLNGGGRDEPLVALTAHLDTVLAPRSPSEIHVGPGGKFHGPGVADNGAGLAALLAVAKAAASDTFPDRSAALLLVANVGEEGEGNLSGMRYLCRQSSLAARIRAFLVLDGPATDHITCQALGSRRFEVAFSGPGGHSWSDYGVGNPVHALSRAVADFADLQRNGSAAPRSSFNFGLIEGGASVNSIPTAARAKLDIRSESAAAMDEMAARLAGSVERALDAENERSSGGKVSARIREIGSRPAGRLPENAPIVEFIRSVDAYLGVRAHLDCASTDANIPLSMGVPAVSIGAGGVGGGAHTPAEWFHPEGRELGLKRVFLTLCHLLRDPR